jgi:invasion protein IalB/uncharacterized caspase-like protein
MVRGAFGLLMLMLMLMLMSSSALAGKRIALLIGNQGYNAKVGPLKNPHDDVALVGRALRTLRFDVTEVRDGDYRAVDAAIKRHVAMVRREGAGAVSLLYYSGHGAADPDTKINYLIPVDVANADDENLWINSLNLNKIVESLREQAPAATHYVVFDACRNELNLTRKGEKALIDKGYVPLAFTPGVMIAYSTAPGKTATDTGSGGGPYAKALAEELVKPGVEAMTMFRRVALKVNREIGQDPWMSASTLPEVYFAGEPSSTNPIAAPPAATQLTEAEHAWAAAKDTNSIAVLEDFVARYKGSFYAGLAQARLGELQNQSASPVPAKAQAVQSVAASSGSASAWVKLCQNTPTTIKDQYGIDQKKDLNVCLTHHERLDGNTGMVLVSAAVRQIEGQDKQHFIVMVPQGMLMQPGMRASIYPRDAWEKIQRNEKIDDSKLKQISLAYTLCQPVGCTAETEATPELIGDLKNNAGIVVLAINATGEPLGFPVPLNGFEQAYRGPPVDNERYSEAREALLRRIHAQKPTGKK